MLVLSRKKNESIVINDDITIVVVEIKGDKVRLGVEAPKEVPVRRIRAYDPLHGNEVTAGLREVGLTSAPVQGDLYQEFRKRLETNDYRGAQSMLDQPHNFEPTEQERYKLSRGLGGLVK